MSRHSRGDSSSRGYRGSQEPSLGKLRVDFDPGRHPPVRITNPSADSGNIIHHDDGFFAFQSSAGASTEAISIIVRAARGKLVHGLIWFEDHPSEGPPSRSRASCGAQLGENPPLSTPLDALQGEYDHQSPSFGAQLDENPPLSTPLDALQGEYDHQSPSFGAQRGRPLSQSRASNGKYDHQSPSFGAQQGDSNGEYDHQSPSFGAQLGGHPSSQQRSSHSAQQRALFGILPDDVPRTLQGGGSSSRQRLTDGHRGKYDPQSQQRCRQISGTASIASAATSFENTPWRLDRCQSIALSHLDEPWERMPPPPRRVPSRSSLVSADTMRHIPGESTLCSIPPLSQRVSDTAPTRRASDAMSLDQQLPSPERQVRNKPLSRQIHTSPERQARNNAPSNEQVSPATALPPANASIPRDPRLPCVERDNSAIDRKPLQANSPIKRTKPSPHRTPRAIVPCKRSERPSSSIDSSVSSRCGMSPKARGKELLRQARLHLSAHPPIQGSVIGSIHSTESDESEFKLVERDGEFTVEFKAQQLRPATDMPTYRCCNCDEKGHAVIDCVIPQADGYVWGCVWCNSRTHNWDNCQAPDKPKAPEAILYMLVVRRGRKPPIVTTVSWYNLFMDSYKGFKLQVRNRGEHVSAKECLVDMALAAGFPLTQARSMWMRINDPDPLIKYDYHKMDTSSLPVDPATKDIDTLVRGHWLQWEYFGGHVAFWAQYGIIVGGDKKTNPQAISENMAVLHFGERPA